MATIYRFIVEQKESKSANSNKPRATKGAAKKGKGMPLFGGGRGGVEHNRKMRAINPLLNKVTNGVWEKGFRLTRAGMGVVNSYQKGGMKGVFGSPGLYILLAFAIITAWSSIAKWNAKERQEAEKLNSQNFKAMENGSGTVHGAYKIAVSNWSGQITYNQNK